MLVVLAGCGPQNAAPSKNPPSAHLSPSSTARVATGPTVDEQIASHELKTGQPPEALAKNILSEISAWEVAGADTVTPDWSAQVKKTVDASDEALSAFLDKYTANQASIYGPALFGPGWATNPDVKHETAINKATLHNAIASNKDKNPYRRSLEFSSVVMSSDSSISIAFIERDNAGQDNRLTDGVNGATGTLSVLYAVQGNNVFFKSIQYTK